MSLDDVYLRNDIENVLAGVALAQLQETENSVEFQRGVKCFTRALVLAFGIDLDAFDKHVSSSLMIADRERTMLREG